MRYWTEIDRDLERALFFFFFFLKIFEPQIVEILLLKIKIIIYTTTGVNSKLGSLIELVEHFIFFRMVCSL
jgi:hypothetical protein